MALSSQDRIFLSDCVNVTWMQRVAVAHALVYGGGQVPRQLAKRAFAAFYPTMPPNELDEMVGSTNQAAGVQAIMLARIFAEFVAGLEETGALARAVCRRRTAGVLRRNLSYQVQDVARYFDEVLALRTPTAANTLAFPTPYRLSRVARPEQIFEYKNLYRTLAKRIVQAGRNYRRIGSSRILKLNTGRTRSDWRSSVHVLVRIREEGAPAAPSSSRKGVVALVYDKLKHGFNVTGNPNDYARLPREPDKIEAVKLSLRWAGVERLLKNIDAIAVLRARIAGTALMLDDYGLL